MPHLSLMGIRHVLRSYCISFCYFQGNGQECHFGYSFSQIGLFWDLNEIIKYKFQRLNLIFWHWVKIYHGLTIKLNYIDTIINMHSGSITTGLKYDVILISQRAIIKSYNINKKTFEQYFFSRSKNVR